MPETITIELTKEQAVKIGNVLVADAQSQLSIVGQIKTALKGPETGNGADHAPDMPKVPPKKPAKRETA